MNLSCMYHIVVRQRKRSKTVQTEDISYHKNTQCIGNMDPEPKSTSEPSTACPDVLPLPQTVREKPGLMSRGWIVMLWSSAVFVSQYVSLGPSICWFIFLSFSHESPCIRRASDTQGHPLVVLCRHLVEKMDEIHRQTSISLFWGFCWVIICFPLEIRFFFWHTKKVFLVLNYLLHWVCVFFCIPSNP